MRQEAFHPEGRSTSNSEPAIASQSEGRYVYSVAECNKPQGISCTGIEGNSVYMVTYKDISAAVHACRCEPYRSDDAEVVKKWVLQHQEVIDTFWQRFNVVLPTAFDTIIKGTDEKVCDWLRDDYSNLKTKLDKVRGKQEFGIQIFWNSEAIAKEIVKESAEIKKLSDDIQSKPRGTSYMYKQKLRNLLERELESRADKYFRNFYDAIKKHADEIHVEKIPNRDEDKYMIMNLSCLLQESKVHELGRELDRISAIPHFSVKFTGPWPAYSFMT